MQNCNIKVRIIEKTSAIFMLIVFTVYSVGVFFTTHSCNTCQYDHIAFTEIDCFHNKHETNNKGGENTAYKTNIKGHCHPNSCQLKINYYKINQSYVQPTITKSIEISDIQHFLSSLLLTDNIQIAKKVKPLPPLYKPIPITQGGELFIIYTQQQVLYA